MHTWASTQSTSPEPLRTRTPSAAADRPHAIRARSSCTSSVRGQQLGASSTNMLDAMPESKIASTSLTVVRRHTSRPMGFVAFVWTASFCRADAAQTTESNAEPALSRR